MRGRTNLKHRQRGHGDYRLIMWIIYSLPYIAAALIALLAWALWRWLK
jgi:hypothetical protein